MRLNEPKRPVIRASGELTPMYGYDEYEDRPRLMFQNRGSSLRRATRGNRRSLPCPTCLAKNKLTPADVQAGYQCDTCADKQERLN